MPVADPSSGRLFIWLISCFLFVSLAAGGSLLLVYMLLPPNQSISWLPVAGVTLVCLPWLFWLLTCFYRIVSRAFGFRMVVAGNCGGGGGGGSSRARSFNEGGNASSDQGGGENIESLRESPSGGGEGRRVQFGGAVVMGNNQSYDQDGRKDAAKKNMTTSNSSNDLSVTSHESEMPLTKAMAS